MREYKINRPGKLGLALKVGNMAYNAIRGAVRGTKAAGRGAGRVVRGAARDVGEVASGDFRRMGQAARNAVASGYKALRRTRDKVTKHKESVEQYKFDIKNIYGDYGPLGTPYKRKTPVIDLSKGSPAAREAEKYMYNKPPKDFAKEYLDGAIEGIRRNRKTAFSPKAQSWGAKMALGGAFAAGGYLAQKRQATGSPAIKKRLYNR